MKKVLSLMLLLTILASVCAAVPAAVAEEGDEGELYYVYTANGKSLNLRAEPNTQARVILKISFGDEFYVSETLGSGWAYGHWNNQFGYVMTRYLTKNKPKSKPNTGEVETEEEYERRKEEEKLADELKNETEVDPYYIAVVATRATGWINFRAGPSKITARIASYPDGKELIVQAETADWYKAQDPETGKVGYINKTFATVLTKAVAEAEPEEDEGTHKLGSLDVNGEFDLTCKLPDGYKMQVVNDQGDRISAAILPEDMTKPELYLTIAYDEIYGEVERMNDMSDEELAILEKSFRDMNDVEITYRETGYGTKLLVARETGSDPDFVDILAIYKGYFVEFKMVPNENAADQTLTEDHIRMCVDFLTDVDFNPVEQAE